MYEHLLVLWNFLKKSLFLYNEHGKNLILNIFGHEKGTC